VPKPAHNLKPCGVVAAEAVADADQGQQPVLVPLDLTVDPDTDLCC
jgi:hypothetical protein